MTHEVQPDEIAIEYVFLLVVDKKRLFYIKYYYLENTITRANYLYHRDAKKFDYATDGENKLRAIIRVTLSENFIVTLNEGNQIALWHQPNLVFVGYEEFEGVSEEAGIVMIEQNNRLLLAFVLKEKSDLKHKLAFWNIYFRDSSNIYEDNGTQDFRIDPEGYRVVAEEIDPDAELKVILSGTAIAWLDEGKRKINYVLVGTMNQYWHSNSL